MNPARELSLFGNNACELKYTWPEVCLYTIERVEEPTAPGEFFGQVVVVQRAGPYGSACVTIQGIATQRPVKIPHYPWEGRPDPTDLVFN